MMDEILVGGHKPGYNQGKVLKALQYNDFQNTIDILKIIGYGYGHKRSMVRVLDRLTELGLVEKRYDGDTNKGFHNLSWRLAKKV